MDIGAGKILVTGGGGFIGGHLVGDLIRQGCSNIRVVDCKPIAEWHQIFPQAENISADLRGWEKLFSERMCRHFREEYGLATRVARYHNVYGPHGTFDGGREKAPAAICRKVIAAKLSGANEIEIWGDGQQTRSFMYIDDCIKGTHLIFESDETDPLNLGSDRLVTVDTVEAIARVKLQRSYNLSAPKGVRGRNSDNALIVRRLGWAPAIPLEVGLERTYRWIWDQMTGGGRNHFEQRSAVPA